MRKFDFNESRKIAILRRLSFFNCVILVCLLFAGNAWGQAKVTVESNISATDSLVFQVWGVEDASVSATPVERTSPNGEQVYCAYDIDITKDGREWQPEPEQPAIVTMDGTNFADGQLVDIYHEGANGPEFVATVASENGKITFPAHSFSVYIVTATGDYARLKVNFHRASEPYIVTVYVKKADLDHGDYNAILYNPGFGTPADGVNCMGWMDNELYDQVDIPYALTFDEISTTIRNTLDAGVEDGNEIDYYAMLFKHYSVTYLAENESVLHTDVVPFRADVDNPTLAYFVSASYTPASSTQNFEGWMVYSHSDGEYIYGHVDDLSNYSNSTEIRITGDVTFRVNVTEGHWLIYHENGKGATYKAADFVRANEVTSRPSLNMRRNGYTFDNWYLGDDSGITSTEPFAFGNELSENTHVWAKWNANTTASYSIIIWKQNVAGDGYDFEEVISLSGNVGSTINTVSRQGGTGENAYARINGANKQYTGFYLNTFDTGVTVATEGNSVLNVYYVRKQYTLTFQDHPYNATTSNSGTQYGLVGGQYVRIYYRNSRWRLTDSNNGTQYTGTRYTQGSGWTTVKEITALYQQSISSYFPIVGTNGATYNHGERWDPQSNTPYSQVLVYIDIMPNANVTFRLDVSDKSTKHIHYYVETISGQTPDRTYNGKGFTEYKTIDANYGFFTEAEDYIDLVGFSKSNSYPPQGYNSSNNSVTQVWGSGSNAVNVYCYYLRNDYIINFMNGAYYDGDNNNLLTDGTTQIETASDIPYGANISSYNNYTPASAPDGYVFEGWYSDKPCTQRFVFTTIPEGGITVYAKWRQIQYRVFLHPNVDPEDVSLNWGSDNQTMNFRITCGDKVSSPTGTRADYEFVGWYTDGAYMHAFDEDASPLNETTVTTPYNKTTDYTDPMDKYGVLGDNPWNSDSMTNATTVRNPERFWITKKFDLYAKWRAILRGAIGINVEYLANGGDNVPSDSKLYQDNTYAIAGHASSHATKEFSHWVLQHWNGADFVDSDIHIYPGAAFTVLKADSKMDNAGWYNSNDSTDIYTGGSYDITGITAPDGIHTVFRATYTIRLRAEYVEIEEPTHTYIEWFRNDGTATVEHIDGESTSAPTLGINVAVEPPVPTREGYNFKGWYRSEESDATITECVPNFLFYNSSTGSFYKEAAYTNAASYVAADNYSPRQYMYAIWEPIVDFTFPAVCQGVPVALPARTKYDIDLAGTWTASSGTVEETVDGTIYTASEGTSVTLTFATTTCPQETSFALDLKTPNVPNASQYDYIWKGGTVSHLADWNIASNWYVYDGEYSVATEMPTRESNIFIGSADCVSAYWPSQTSEAFAHNLTIADGASLTVPSNRILNIAGNLENIGTLDALDGTVVFCGPSTNGGDQSISNDIAFGDVIFKNQGGNIIPRGSIAINHTATFDNGLLIGNVTFRENAKACGESHHSFVAGTVTKLVGDLNESNFVFPTGSHSANQPDVLGSIRVETLAKNSTTTVTFYQKSVKNNDAEETNGFNDLPRWWHIADMDPSNSPQLDHVSNFEYWRVNTTADLAATLTVKAADPSAHFGTPNNYDPEKIYSAMYMGGYWKNMSSTHGSISDGNTTISVVANIPPVSSRATEPSYLTLASTDRGTLLPIELLSFTADCNGKSVELAWTTASERNNDYFSLERSSDAINFKEIARIAGAGNSIEQLDYTYTDYSANGGETYYRLVQVDYDGTRSVSEIVVAICDDTYGEPDVQVFPNPFHDNVTVHMDNFADETASIEVYDMLGRAVLTDTVSAGTDNEVTLNFGTLSAGTYNVRVSTANYVVNKQVVKE